MVDTARLESWLAAALGWAAPRIGETSALRAGWESDVTAFDVVHASGSHRLVVRLYVGHDASVKALREFQGMRRLGVAGFPVPAVVGVEADSDVLGRPFLVMEFVAGDDEWTWQQAAESPDFTRLLVELHSLDWRPFAADSPAVPIEETIAEFRRYLAVAPVPGFKEWLVWLEDRLPSVPRLEPSVVHWDYHPGNVLVTEDGMLWIIDWTQVSVSDRRFDLAWSGLLMMESIGANTLTGAYEELAGPMPAMEWFELAVCVRRLFSIVASLEHGPEVMGMREEARDLMRAQIGSLRSSYDWGRDTTGIAIPAVESLLGD